MTLKFKVSAKKAENSKKLKNLKNLSSHNCDISEDSKA